jgi:hypothetical protein
MHDACRVRYSQAFGDHTRQPKRFSHRQAASRNRLSQGPPIHELHCYVVLVLGSSDFVDADYAGMMQCRRCFGFLEITPPLLG